MMEGISSDHMQQRCGASAKTDAAETMARGSSTVFRHQKPAGRNRNKRRNKLARRPMETCKK